ncbi:MAG TPA: HAD family hydrolase [Balneolaceae bacterium]|nr:HAD family hydrolase [Balneolaceae bacterium]
MRKAIFIDKDGTLIKNVPYNINPRLIKLQPNAGEALKQLQDESFRIIVVTNQSGVARGFFAESKLQKVEQKIKRLLKRCGVELNGFYYCPHLPKDEGSVEGYCHACRCRKPKPGLLFKAATMQSIKLKKSWMIGDILNDVEAGNRAGCHTILLDNGGETEWMMSPQREPDKTVRNWDKICKVILNRSNRNIFDSSHRKPTKTGTI